MPLVHFRSPRGELCCRRRRAVVAARRGVSQRLLVHGGDEPVEFLAKVSNLHAPPPPRAHCRRSPAASAACAFCTSLRTERQCVSLAAARSSSRRSRVAMGSGYEGSGTAAADVDENFDAFSFAATAAYTSRDALARGEAEMDARGVCTPAETSASTSAFFTSSKFTSPDRLAVSPASPESVSFFSFFSRVFAGSTSR